MNLINNEPMIYLHLRVPAEMKESLQSLADADRRKLSDYIRIILEDHINKKCGE